MSRRRMIVALIFLIHILNMFYAYNYFRIMEHEMDIARDNLEVEVQRRHDVLFNAVTAVEEYRDVERRLIDHFCAERGSIGAAGYRNTDEKITALLLRLNVLYEKYPGLRSQDSHELLMNIISASGRRVSEARGEFNRKTLYYNLSIKKFPRKIAAWVMGFHEEEFFHAGRGADMVPVVKAPGYTVPGKKGI
ncbi:MAG: LemA family protein [Nitrospirota bacterium]|nr:LemA family protein [Nitrospirota bacterium]